MTPEAERETLKIMRNYIKGNLAVDPLIFGAALDVLSDIARRDNADNDWMNKRNRPTGDQRGEQAA